MLWNIMVLIRVFLMARKRGAHAVDCTGCMEWMSYSGRILGSGSVGKVQSSAGEVLG